MLTLVSKEQKDYFWKKKEFVSFVLSILVFLIHISSFGQYTDSESTIGIVNEKVSFFFKESITRFAVPMYFILSGITFFRDYDNKRYGSKLKSRFFTLCIPYLIWNTLCMLFECICSYTFVARFFSGRKLFTLSVANVLEGIFLHKCNIPFWYILYLLVFVLCAPVFYLLIRNKYVGIISVILLSILNVFEPGSALGIKYDSIVFFLIGALLGKHYFLDLAKKTCRKTQLVSLTFLAVYVLAKNLHPQNEYFMLPFVKIIIFTLSSFALWNLADMLLEKIPNFPIFARSFPIFAMHTNVSAIIYKILYLILPKSGYSAIPNFLLTFFLTLIVMNIFCIVFERFCPETYALVMGKGIKKTRITRKELPYV